MMIIRSNDYFIGDPGLAGGKGANLMDMHHLAFNVPPFIILTTEWFKNLSSADSVKEKAENIGQEFFAIGAGPFAVRSSANAEDSISHSFAGQFKTHLNVPLNGIPDAVASVWNSKNSEGVRRYQEATGSSRELEMAVIVQQMIPATVSGVAFGLNPLTGDPSERVINAVRGLGEGLVSGEKNADKYIIGHKKDISKTITGSEPVLNDNQILFVAGMVDKLQEHFGGPLDIEFSFLDDDLYVLQHRPVTNVKRFEKIIWDNSNIVESYPGLTLPLTFSFIEKMYGAVYRQFSLVLGVSEKRVAANADVYANMLGLLNGRVYYNLNSWYRSLAELPGYSVNAEFMEKMMGVKEKPEIKLPAREKAGIADYWQILRAIIHIGRNRYSARKQKEKFVRSFDTIYAQFDKKDFTAQPLTAILNDYRQFEQMMVSEWKAPLVNDFFAMIYFGLLQKICAKNIPAEKNLHNELIASSKDIVTTEPLRLLPEIAKKISANKQLEHVFLHLPEIDAWRMLQQPDYAKELESVNDYLDTWGERTVAELKLETITYKQQPEKLIGLIQSYIRNKLFYYTPDLHAEEKREKAERIFFDALKNKPIARRLAKHVLEGARYFISNRENLRYYRTKGFGMVRRIFLALGERMVKEEFLQDHRNIFYLELKELENIVAKRSGRSEIEAIIASRKKNYDLFRTLPLPERVETFGKPGEFIIHPASTKDISIAAEWQGIPCSAGVVKAKVKKLREADAITSMDKQILATYATDPGWVVLFPSASGIITERGSLLSHAAIVSREMGIPCIVGIPDLMGSLEDGAEIIMDGSTGVIRVIKNQEDERD